MNYYRWSLLQPVLLAALAVPSALRGDKVAIALVYVFLFSATSYTAWVGNTLQRLRGKGEDEARRLAIAAPLPIATGNALFFVLFQVCKCLEVGNSGMNWHYFTSGMSILERVIFGVVTGLIIGVSAVFSPSIVIAYLWIAYINGTLNILKRCGWVSARP